MPNHLYQPNQTQLPSSFQQALAQKRYNLSVRLLLKGDSDDYGARRIAHAVTGIIELECWDETWNELVESKAAEGGPKPIEIGYISGWRILSSDPDDILLWSDQIDFDVYPALSWLIFQKTQRSIEAALLIDRVVIQPCWQGQQLTSRAVATYLDLIGCKFVFLQPAPLNTRDLPPQQQDLIKHRLKRYWQKLGLKHYDLANNIAWTDHWQCPQWLQADGDG